MWGRKREDIVRRAQGPPLLEVFIGNGSESQNREEKRAALMMSMQTGRLSILAVFFSYAARGFLS